MGVFTHLDAQRALPGRRDHAGRLEQRADARRQAQALQACRGQHDGVEAALVELAQPRVEVAAQRLDLQVGRTLNYYGAGASARGRVGQRGGAAVKGVMVLTLRSAQSRAAGPWARP
jgi:hypothetical protein